MAWTCAAICRRASVQIRQWSTACVSGGDVARMGRAVCVGERKNFWGTKGTFPNGVPNRSYSENTHKNEGELSGRGLIVGCYETEGGYEFSEEAKGLDARTQGRLTHLLNVSGGTVEQGDCRLFYDFTEDHTHVAVVGVGSHDPSGDHQEDIDVRRQNIRSAAAVGTKVLQKARVAEIQLDDLSDPKACAEGSVLSLFSFDSLKPEKKRKKTPSVQLLSQGDSAKSEAWTRGVKVAVAQNFARQLSETPSNHMTPTQFVEAVSSRLGQVAREGGEPGRLAILPRPLSWIECQKMGAFLSVAKGSQEKPWLLELRYNYGGEQDEANPSAGGGGEDRPIVLVGKGVTFDTGGISIKPSANMGLMRGDMGGAACVAATVLAIAHIGLPVSVVGIIPLCENMPSGTAVKPGDVVRAMSGKTIEVDNTDAEGRLLLADALTYAHIFNPTAIIDVATLTGAMDVALGTGAAGVFSNSNELWSHLHKAGQRTGDRLWRMPLFEQYTKQMESRLADINNVGTRGRSAGSCTAAAFLKEFVDHPSWAHLDIAGVMESQGEEPFLDKGMSGRPTRTLIQYLEDSV